MQEAEKQKPSVVELLAHMKGAVAAIHMDRGGTTQALDVCKYEHVHRARTLRCV